MRITDNLRIVLRGICEDAESLRQLAALPFWEPGLSNRQAARKRLLLVDFQQYGVPLDFGRWLGHPPSPSESASLSRSVRRMEEEGLLVRFNANGQTTHVRLTAEGESLAERLLPGICPQGKRHSDAETHTQKNTWIQ